MDLSTYTGVKDAATIGSLVGAVKYDKLTTGFSAMPQGAPKLSDCDISLIQKWVREGALNN